MKQLIVLLALICPFFISAQCEIKEYQRLIKEAQNAQKNGQYDLAIKKLQSAQICQPEKEALVNKLILEVYREINEQKDLAVKNKAEATRQSDLAQKEKNNALKYAVEAQKQRDTALTERNNAEKRTRELVANDLVYKSKNTLNSGDFNTAFRLAEFAYRYADSDNFKVIQALADAFYYNSGNTGIFSPRVATLEGHTAEILCVAFSPDQKHFATGSKDKTVKIWDFKNGKTLFTLHGHLEWVFSIAFSPDGKYLATGSADTEVKIWEVKSGNLIYTLKGHVGAITCLTFASDSKYLATGSDDATVIIWDLATGNKKFTLKGHSNNITCISFSANNKRVATGSSDRTARVWELESGKEILILEVNTESIQCIAFSPVLNHLIIGYADKTIKVCDLQNGEDIQTNYMAKGDFYFSFNFSPFGEVFMVRDEFAEIWPMGGENANASYKIQTNGIAYFEFSSDRKYLATVEIGQKSVRIWNLEGSKTYNTCKGRLPFSFSPDGKSIVTCDDNSANIWDIKNGNFLGVLKGHAGSIMCMAFSPDGKFLATGANDRMANIWDWRNGKLLFVLNDCDDRDCNIQSVSFSPDSKHLALGTQNDYDEGKIQIWDIENKRILQKVEGYWVNGQNVAYSPDGRYLVSGATILNPENLQVLYTLSGEGEATNIDFSPDGTRLAIGYSNKEVILWDLESRRPVGALKGHLGPINCVAFSPDGKRLATASRDFTVRIWDIETGNMLLSFKELKGTIEQITFSPDSKNIATAASGIYGTDDPIKIFELEAGSLIRLWEQNGRRANLDLGQLQTFGLYELLDLKPGNEVNLIETGEVWQIKAFADLATAQVLDNDIISRASVFYSRADRLYNAALSLQDEDLIRKDYATMLRNYAKMYEPTDMLKSIDLEKKADKIWIEADEDVFQPAKIKNH